MAKIDGENLKLLFCNLLTLRNSLPRALSGNSREI